MTKEARTLTHLLLHGNMYNGPSFAFAAGVLRSAHQLWKQMSRTTLAVTQGTLTRTSFHRQVNGSQLHLEVIPRRAVEGNNQVCILRTGVLHKGGAIVLTHQMTHLFRLRSITCPTQQTSREPSYQ
jgi:hypothetical protein